MNNSSDKIEGYRKDIDGLRALAVLSVIAFHAGLSMLPGGFVGVDIFFVISGFLITKLIFTELETNIFTLKGFWLRRVKRILPALLVMVVTSLIAGWFILMPNDLKDLGQSAFAQSLLSSNFYFWLKADYFAPPSLQKPLLHTWTLSLEEQFYITLPILLILLKKSFGQVSFVILSIALAVSLVASITSTPDNPTLAFYTLPFRAWEFLLGSLLAHKLINELPRSSSHLWLNTALAAAGLAAIMTALVVFNENTLLPGYASLLPCLGAAALIFAGGRSDNVISRLLSSPVMSIIGQASYSLYLWHWPVFVYARYLSDNILSPAMTVACLITTAILGFISYIFIEKPLRKETWNRSIAAGPMACLAASVTIAAVGLAYSSFNGFPSRLSPQTRAAYENAFKIISYKNECNRLAGLEDLPACASQGVTKAPDIIVWGDSHTWAILPALDNLALQNNTSFLRYQCLPLFDAYRVDRDTSLETSFCHKANQKMLTYIKLHKIKKIIFVAAWSRLTEGRELRMEGSGQVEAFVADNLLKSSNSIESKQVFHRQFEATVQQLTDIGVQVYILKQVPQHRFWVANELAKAMSRSTSFKEISRPLSEHVQRQAFVNTVFDAIVKNNPLVQTLDPEPYFCDQTKCQATSGGQALYFDFHHLT
ncbi:MAG: acyltransferase family protein, partial [Anderseniella sp.]